MLKTRKTDTAVWTPDFTTANGRTDIASRSKHMLFTADLKAGLGLGRNLSWYGHHLSGHYGRLRSMRFLPTTRIGFGYKTEASALSPAKNGDLHVRFNLRMVGVETEGVEVRSGVDQLLQIEVGEPFVSEDIDFANPSRPDRAVEAIYGYESIQAKENSGYLRLLFGAAQAARDWAGA